MSAASGRLKRSLDSIGAWWHGRDAAGAESADPDAPDAADDGACPAGDIQSLALELLWGEGRARPGDAAADARLIAPLALSSETTVAWIGAELGASCAAAADLGAHVIGYEWRAAWRARAAAFAAARASSCKLTIKALDAAAPALESSEFDAACALMSLSDLPDLAAALHCTRKALGEGGLALVVETVLEDETARAAQPGPLTLDAWRELWAQAGFDLRTSDEVTGSVLAATNSAMSRVSGRVERFARSGGGAGSGAEVLVAARQAIAAEQMRLKALERGDLAVYRFLAAKTPRPD